MDVAKLKSGETGVEPLSRSVYAGRLGEFPDVALADAAALQRRRRWGDHFRERIGPQFDGRITFEVGCFDAEFLCRIAAKNPGTAFVGLDWKCKAIYDGARRITEMGLRNVALIRGRGQDVARIFGPGEVDEIWVFHPDPCDKANESKNRLMTERFVEEAHATLREAGSRLALKTDHAGYYRSVIDLFEGSESLRSKFEVVTNTADFWNDPAAAARVAGRHFAAEVTTFERRFIRKRQPIYYFEVAKR